MKIQIIRPFRNEIYINFFPKNNKEMIFPRCMHVCGYMLGIVRSLAASHYAYYYSFKLIQKKKKKEFGGESVTFDVSRMCGGI